MAVNQDRETKTNSWSWEQDCILRDALQEARCEGIEDYAQLSFWKRMESHKLLPDGQSADECLARSQHLLQSEKPPHRSPQDKIVTKVSPSNNAPSHAVERASIISNMASESKVDPKGLVVNLLDNSADEKEVLRGNQEYRASKLELENQLEFEAGGDLGYCARTLFSLSNIPEVGMVLNTTEVKENLYKRLRKVFGSPKSVEVIVHLNENSACVHLDGIMGKIRTILSLNIITQCDLSDLLESSHTFFEQESLSKALKNCGYSLLKILLDVVKVMVSQRPDRSGEVTELYRGCVSRFREWGCLEFFAGRSGETIVSDQIKELKQFILNKHNGMLQTMVPAEKEIRGKLSELAGISCTTRKRCQRYFAQQTTSPQNPQRGQANENLSRATVMEVPDFFSDKDEAGELDGKETYADRKTPLKSTREHPGARPDSVKLPTTKKGEEFARTGHYSPKEDALIRDGIAKFGFGKWIPISKLFEKHGILRQPMSIKDRARSLGMSSDKKRKRAPTAPRRQKPKKIRFFESDDSFEELHGFD